MKKRYEVLLFLVLIFLLGFFLNKELLGSAICKRTISKPIDYTTGNIIVVFRQDINPGEAVSTIESYGLKPELFTKWDSFIDVKVPEGQETKWICRLSSNKRIKHAMYKLSLS